MTIEIVHLITVGFLLAMIGILLWGILQTTSSILSLLQDELEDVRSFLRRFRPPGSR
jgi:hypothetical protein